MTFDISGNKPSGKAAHRNEKNYGRAVCKSLVVACCLSGLDILSIWIFTLGTLMTIIFIEAFRRWHALLQMTKRVTDPSGDEVLALAGDSVVAPVAIR